MGMLAHSSPCSCKHGTVSMVEKHLRVHENKRTAMFSQHLGSEFPAPGKKMQSITNIQRSAVSAFYYGTLPSSAVSV